jgi:hypothetical protein
MNHKTYVLLDKLGWHDFADLGDPVFVVVVVLERPPRWDKVGGRTWNSLTKSPKTLPSDKCGFHRPNWMGSSPTTMPCWFIQGWIITGCTIEISGGASSCGNRGGKLILQIIGVGKLGVAIDISNKVPGVSSLVVKCISNSDCMCFRRLYLVRMNQTLCNLKSFKYSRKSNAYSSDRAEELPPDMGKRLIIDLSWVLGAYWFLLMKRVTQPRTFSRLLFTLCVLEKNC